MTDSFSELASNAPTTEPVFPHFKPLEMSDRSAIEAFTRQFEPYSDFCFSTLYFYDSDQRTRWCWLNGNLVLCLHDGFGPGEYLTFLGNNRAAATAGTLIEHARRTNCSLALHRVPEITALAIAQENTGLLIGEDRAGFDYIYSSDLLARLNGSPFYKLRRDASRFKRRHPQHRFVTLNLSNASVCSQLQPSISTWLSQKNATRTVQDYHHALERCLEHARHFDFLSFGVVVNGSMAGFTIAQSPTRNWLLSHFVVANPAFIGLSGCMLNYLALCGSALGCAHLNYQEDVGDPGLRRFKMTCVPSRFLKKFSISRFQAEP